MVKEAVLSNGLSVVYERLPHVRSVCIGIWVKAGSVNETSEQRGISHFIEHMLFKGTANRTVRDIAGCFDDIGGHLNAFTGKELTCIYAKTLDEHMHVTLEVVSDMVLHSLFDPGMIRKEQKVICEEIAMCQDSPEDFIHDRLCEHIWKGHPLSHTVLGTRTSVRSLGREQLISYMNEMYTSGNMLVTAVGNFEEQPMLQAMEPAFSGIPARAENSLREISPVPFHCIRRHYQKNVEQAYLSLAMQGVGYESDDRFALAIASNVLGGGMSSRLFQTAREEKSLVYSIGSTVESYQKSGILNIYADTGPRKIPKLLDCIRKEVEQMRQKGLSDGELRKAKDQLKGNLVLGLENTDTRMASMARSRLLRGSVTEIGKVMEQIDIVTNEDILRVAETAFAWEKKAIAILTAKPRNLSAFNCD